MAYCVLSPASIFSLTEKNAEPKRMDGLGRLVGELRVGEGRMLKRVLLTGLDYTISSERIWTISASTKGQGVPGRP